MFKKFCDWIGTKDFDSLPVVPDAYCNLTFPLNNPSPHNPLAIMSRNTLANIITKSLAEELNLKIRPCEFDVTCKTPHGPARPVGYVDATYRLEGGLIYTDSFTVVREYPFDVVIGQTAQMVHHLTAYYQCMKARYGPVTRTNY